MTRTVKNAITILLPLAAVFCIGCNPAPPERAEDDRTLNSYYATGWAVGHWVRYDYTVSGSRSSIYIAITDSEMINGEIYFWLETVKRNGAAVVATRQLVPDSGNGAFVEASGGLLPGAKRFLVKRENTAPVEYSPSDIKNSGVIDLEGIFAPGETSETTIEDNETKYVTESGKELECSSRIYRRGSEWMSVILYCSDVPVTGIARSKSRDGKLELVDFGNSGADGVF